ARTRLLAAVQGVLLLQVLRQGGVGVGPGSEVVQPAADLLGPHASSVREEGEVGCRLVGFGAGCRMRANHATGPLLGCRVVTAHPSLPGGPLSPFYRV